MKRTILAPIDLATPERVGGRLWRKQVLRKDTIHYPTADGSRRTIEFDDQYLADLAESFNAGAFDQVAFQLADAANTHTVDPERFRGEVKALAVTPEGLDALVEVTPEGQEILERNPRLGVSVRIKEQIERVDGRKFRRAVHHVLGTLDPRVTGLAPWQPAEGLALAEDDGPVLDLSTTTYAQEAPQMWTLTVTDEQLAELRALGVQIDLAEEDGGEDLDVDLNPEVSSVNPDEGTELTDEELLAALDAELDEDPAEGPEEDPAGDAEEDPDEDAAEDPDEDDEGDEEGENEEDDAESADLASGDDWDRWLDLAEETAPSVDLAETVTANARAAAAEFDVLARDLIDAGVPPAAVDLARPVLATDPTTVDLAVPTLDGDPVDVRATVRGLLEQMRGTVDLAAESGHSQTTPSGDDPVGAAWDAFLNE